MLTNKPNYEDAFDKMLRCGLKKHTEPDRPDFKERLLRQIETRRQQKILAEIVFEERLALAGCIILPLAAVAVFLFFPEIPHAVSSWTQNLFTISRQTISDYVPKIQLWHAFIIIAGIAIYYVFDFVTEEF
jgi:hypothetical protein